MSTAPEVKSYWSPQDALALKKIKNAVHIATSNMPVASYYARALGLDATERELIKIQDVLIRIRNEVHDMLAACPKLPNAPPSPGQEQGQ